MSDWYEIHYGAEIKRCRDIILNDERDGFIRSIDFVLATIQQQFHTVPNILFNWKTYGTDHPTMWGMKKDGWLYVREHQNRLYTLMQYAVDKRDPVEAIDTLLEIPGLNTVKAAFVAQLHGLDVGCLDTHNAALYDVNPTAWNVTSKLSARLRLAKIESYVEFCRKIGPSYMWWGNWCEFMANKYPNNFEDADEVSHLHHQALRK